MLSLAVVATGLPDRIEQFSRSLKNWKREFGLLDDRSVGILVYCEEWDASPLLKGIIGNDYAWYVRPNMPKSGSILEGYKFLTEHGPQARHYLFSGPEFLFQSGLVKNALNNVESGTTYHHKCYWIPDHMQKHLDDYPWMEPEKLIEHHMVEMCEGTPHDQGAPVNRNIAGITEWNSNSTWMVKDDTLEKMLPFPNYPRTWGPDDPGFHHLRTILGIRTVTCMSHQIFHQNHPPTYPPEGWNFDATPLIEANQTHLNTIWNNQKPQVLKHLYGKS